MGGQQSTDGPRETEHEAAGSADMSEGLAKLLEENTYAAGSGKYPYIVVQLAETEELRYNDMLVSDAIAAHLRTKRYTHIIAQTHGWNTPPDKAIAVPFTEFMGGMQNDAAMPKEEFHPLFVAFIWPALPIEIARTGDALTRAELLSKQERELVGEDSDIAAAADAAKHALEVEDEDDEDLLQSMRGLASHTRVEEEEEEEEVEVEEADAVVTRARERAGAEFDEDGNEVVQERGLLDGVKRIFRPVENLVFGRLMARGQRVGAVMGGVLGKMMNACDNRPRVCMMANSLGAHVLCGVLRHADALPWRVHTVFFVQGAITRELFEAGGKFGRVHEMVAGPTVCSYSSRDLMLKNVFGPFHGMAVGFVGATVGRHLDMKAVHELEESPYELENGSWNSVDGSKFIDEGNPIAGGHGDFKEDETTSLYWAAIKAEVSESAYDM